MSDGKDTRSFFRKVVNFVVNPRSDPADSNPSDDGGRESEFAKSELKAMIERKRRNDFVRKRELDLLRKLRREGLTPEQLAALGSSSGMADTQIRGDEPDLAAEPGMKAKIDEIELQMAASAIPGSLRRPIDASSEIATMPARLAKTPPSMTDLARSMADTIIDVAQLDFAPPRSSPKASPRAASSRAAERSLAAELSGFSTNDAPAHASASTAAEHDFGGSSGSAVEVTEVGHDPELDEAVISYANGDSANAERLLRLLIGSGGSRRMQADTWMVVFDLYRSTGQQVKFEQLASDYAERFGQSAPHWFSVPKMIADAAAANRPTPSKIDGSITWSCPPRLDAAAVALLRVRSQNAAQPWVFDWSGFESLQPEAWSELLDLFTQWLPRQVDMRWIGGERLLFWLSDETPIGMPDVDQRLWQLRLLVLRMVNRAEKFDEVAIDYCVTFEISPPSWEPATCQVRISGPVGTTSNVALTSIVGEPSTSFVESELADQATMVQVVSLELTGQLVGDIGSVLDKLDKQIGAATRIDLSCLKLLRVDFMASGELLNWVLACNRNQRSVSFIDTNRLVARFFSAVGIDAYAAVKVRAV